MIFTFCDRQEDTDHLSQKRWLYLLYYTRENQINLERVGAVAELENKNLVLDYVERTLSILETHTELSSKERYYVQTALEWAETAKCGMPEQRAIWQKKGYSLDIHNEASAAIFMEENEDAFSEAEMNIISTLIRTHGLLGQYIRGEVNFDVHEPLAELIRTDACEKEMMKHMLLALNHCIIAAVSDELWSKLKEEVSRLVTCICEQQVSSEQMPLLIRLQKLFPAFRQLKELTPEQVSLYESILAHNDLWYAQSAISSFRVSEIDTIFGYLEPLTKETKHISFYPLAQELTYDYQGKRKINVYKKRIVELCLREYAQGISDGKSSDHISIQTKRQGDTLLFHVAFTKACASLVNFCVEAERSGIMDYTKSIQIIFDIFGFRRDIFDRLNNEEDYLNTMNAADDSTKYSILDHVVGDTVVDVGSGGGVLLDRLETEFPQKKIIGTDISTNVIEVLNTKIVNEGHSYQVMRHNFVEDVLTEKVDTILFSSIIHEIFSYTEWEGAYFRKEAVVSALKHAVDSLRPNGRIIIRDGVMCPKSAVGKITFKEPSGISFCKNYCQDFGGLSHLRNADSSKTWKKDKVMLDGAVLTADLDFIREALYTYTWGDASYAQEVKEQFGYFTLEEYISVLESLDMHVIKAESFTEQGYPDHLNPLVTLEDGLTWDDLPSTCILVAEKKN